MRIERTRDALLSAPLTLLVLLLVRPLGRQKSFAGWLDRPWKAKAAAASPFKGLRRPQELVSLLFHPHKLDQAERLAARPPRFARED
jgi:hypothetical protein